MVPVEYGIESNVPTLGTVAHDTDDWHWINLEHAKVNRIINAKLFILLSERCTVDVLLWIMTNTLILYEMNGIRHLYRRVTHYSTRLLMIPRGKNI